MYQILFAKRRFKNSRFYKECMNSSALLPPRNFAVFESQFLLKCQGHPTDRFGKLSVWKGFNPL